MRSLAARSTPTTYRAHGADSRQTRGSNFLSLSTISGRTAISGMFRAPYGMYHHEKWEKWYIAIWENERGEKCINKDLSPSPIIPSYGYSLSPHLLALKDWLAYDLAPTLRSFRSAANKTVVFPAIDFWVQSRPPTCTARSIVCERLLLFVSTRPLCEYNANILIDGRGGAIEVL